MKYWLVKTDPDTYSWHDFLAEKETTWDGVRNYQARNNLGAMAVGDKVIVYHSVSGKCAMGCAEVTQAAFPDPKAAPDDGWLAVRLKAVLTFPRPISLAEIKVHPLLSGISLIKQSRLSVLPLSEEEFSIIIDLGSK